MSKQYFVTFKNLSQQNKVIHFAIYQQYPSLPGLKQVAWKKAGVYKNGQATVGWSTTYNAVLSNYHDEFGTGVFSNSQIPPANFKDQFGITDMDVRIQAFLTSKT